MRNEVNGYMSIMQSEELDVSRLMDQIREEARKKRDQHMRFLNWEKIVAQKQVVDLASIEALINEADRFSQVRTQLPQTLNRFPFNRSKILQNYVLRAYELLFREQRLVNQMLIDALRKVISVNHILHTQTISLEVNQTNMRNALQDAISQIEASAVRKEESHIPDRFYAEFEDRFRGTREEIKERLRIYLPIIEKTKAGSASSPVLDIGCGRGEWLELLKEHGLHARGIDLNRVVVDGCRARGLDVAEDDAINHLRSLPGASVGSVTGFHVIEHLPFGALLQVFNEALRVLVPGGVVIFETPNPENIITGSVNFYTDPTHLRPLPSGLMRFTAESRGYVGVEILPLRPYPDHVCLTGSDVSERFNEYFYGPQDYALIGYKP